MEASFEVYFFLTFLTENVHTACLVAQQHHSALPYHAAFIFSCNCLVLSFVLPGSANLALLFNYSIQFSLMIQRPLALCFRIPFVLLD